jgi:hypothetical protein
LSTVDSECTVIMSKSNIHFSFNHFFLNLCNPNNCLFRIKMPIPNVSSLNRYHCDTSLWFVRKTSSKLTEQNTMSFNKHQVPFSFCVFSFFESQASRDLALNKPWVKIWRHVYIVKFTKCTLKKEQIPLSKKIIYRIRFLTVFPLIDVHMKTCNPCFSLIFMMAIWLQLGQQIFKCTSILNLYIRFLFLVHKTDIIII